MPDGVSPFSGVAGQYDAVRPSPPDDLLALISQWAGLDRPDVVDLGAGTGLSAVAWAGRARHVTAVEPSDAIRRLAGRRIAGLGAAAGTRFTVAATTAEDTGLPDGCADVVTASQAMQWFDPDRALPEIARLLHPGGVLAAYDGDWLSWTDWETAAAWDGVVSRVEAEQARRGIPGKEHLGRLQRSGLFRHCAEIAMHGRDEGDAGRLAELALGAITDAAGFLAGDATEDELELTTLRKTSARRLSEPLTWWWTCRARLAVR